MPGKEVPERNVVSSSVYDNSDRSSMHQARECNARILETPRRSCISVRKQLCRILTKHKSNKVMQKKMQHSPYNTVLEENGRKDSDRFFSTLRPFKLMLSSSHSDDNISLKGLSVLNNLSDSLRPFSSSTLLFSISNSTKFSLQD